jgi:hypothetical protein
MTIIIIIFMTTVIYFAQLRIVRLDPHTTRTTRATLQPFDADRFIFFAKAGHTGLDPRSGLRSAMSSGYRTVRKALPSAYNTVVRTSYWRADRGVTSASTSLSTHLIASTNIVCISVLSQLASTWPSVE